MSCLPCSLVKILSSLNLELMFHYKQKIFTAFLLVGAIFSSLASHAQEFKKLVWADEFNYSGLPDSTKWSYDIGRGCPDNCGWGNRELQYYTVKRPENARVENGQLIIEARKEKFADANYTSARLLSK